MPEPATRSLTVPRDEHLAGGSFGSDAGTGVDGDPRDFAVH
jgi:hypothetical protein